MRQLTARVLATLPALAFAIAAASAKDPLANAGPDRIVEADGVVRLDASRSQSPVGNELSYAWSVVSGAVSINDPAAVRPLVRLNGTSAVVRLTVKDGDGAVYTDEVQLAADGLRPQAAPGRTIGASVGEEVRLSAAGSVHPGRQPISFAWRVVSTPSGNTAVLVGSDTITPSFTVGEEGETVLELIVTDAVGVPSEPSRFVVSTRGSAPVAQAGDDRSVAVGAAVRLDADGTIDADGDELAAEWSILSAPLGSSAALGIDQSGRQTFTADVAGDYVVQLAVSDGVFEDRDTVLVTAGGPAGVAPIAVAQATGFAGPGQPISLDGKASYDRDGDALSYAWTVLAAPDSAAAEPEDPAAPATTMTSSTSDDTLVQLSVTDEMGHTAYDTVLLPQDIAAALVSAGPDALIVDGQAALTGAVASGAPVSWSHLALGPVTDDAAFAAPGSAGTTVRFRPKADQPPLRRQGSEDGVALLGQYGIITAGSLEAETTLHEPAFVGGDLTGGKVSFNGRASEGEALVVVGNVLGETKQVTGGQDVRLGGAGVSIVKTTGKGKVLTDPTLSATSTTDALLALSAETGGLVATGSVATATDKKGHTESVIDALPGPNGVAVFDIADASEIFGASAPGSIRVDVGEASAVLINVGGATVDISGVSLTGSVNSQADSAKVLWNFHEASGVAINAPFRGVVLAPKAHVVVGQNVKGALAAASARIDAPIHGPRFEGGELTGEAMPLAVVQVASGDGAIDTAVLTTGNVRPGAALTAPEQARRDEAVTFDGSGSSDANGDALSYEWSLAARPEGSGAALAGSGAAAELTPDVRGHYVAQLVVRDGELASEPATHAVEVVGYPPVAVASIEGDARVRQALTLDGTASTDRDGDALAYQWRITSRPDGSVADVFMGGLSVASFTPDVPGPYTALLTVTDTDGFSDAAIVAFDAIEVNRPPALAAVADRTVSAGDTIEFAVSASDPDGDPLQLGVSPLPLPAGASFDAATGAFSFATSPKDAGTYRFDFEVSDGRLSASAGMTLTVEDPDPALGGSLAGRVVDSITGQSIAAAEVRVGGQISLTGADGSFVVSGLPAGDAVMTVLGPQGTSVLYGVVSVRATVAEEGRVYVGDVRLYSLSGPSASVEPGQDTVVAGDGIELRIPANALVSGRTEPHRYWRVFMHEMRTNDDPRYLYLRSAEVTFRDGSVPIPMTGGIALASSEYNGNYRAALAFDGNAGTQWASQSPVGQWIGYDFGPGADISVTGLSLTAPTDSPTQLPSRFDVQYSDDGMAWTTAFSYEELADATPWVIGEVRSYDMLRPYEGQVATGVLAASQVNGLPDRFVPCELIAIGSEGFFATEAAELTVRNYDDLAVGTVVDLWRLAGGEFAIAGEGRVTSASEITALIDNLESGGVFALAPRGPRTAPAAMSETGITAYDLLSRGNLKSTYALPGFDVLGRERSVSLTYNSQIASPTTFLDTRLDFQDVGALPSKVTSYAEVGGVWLGEPATIDLTEGYGGRGAYAAEDGPISQSVAVPTGALPTGAHPYRFVSVSAFKCSRVPSVSTSRFTVNNPDSSPYGQGWNVTELSRLTEQPDGSVVITEGDGTTAFFRNGQGLLGVFEDENGEYLEPTVHGGGLVMTMYDTPDSIGAVANQFRGLTAKPFSLQVGDGAAETVTSMRSTVNFPASDYSINQFYGTGLDNRFGDGSTGGAPTEDDVRIIPPGGNDTFGSKFEGFLFVPRSGDLTVTVEIDNSFDLFIGGQSVMRYYDLAPILSFTVTLEDVQAGFVPITLYHSESTINASVVLQVSGGGIEPSDDPVVIESRYPDAVGAHYLYDRIPSGDLAGLLSPDGDFSRLERQDDGSYTRTYPDGTVWVYDARGLLAEVRDLNGNTRAYAYDADGRVTSVTDPGGLVTRFVYRADGTLETIQDPAGRDTLFVFDDARMLASAEDPDGRVLYLEYDENVRMTARRDARGLVTTYAYGPGGTYAGSLLPDGTSVAMEVARSLGLEGLGAPEGAPYVLEADRVTTLTDGRGNTTVTEVNGFGAIVRTVDPLGRETRLARDENNLVVRIDEPSPATSSGRLVATLAYDGNGSVTRQTEAVGTPLERTTAFEYGENARLLSVTDADGHVTRMTYDARGNMTERRDPTGAAQTIVYEARGLPIIDRDPNGNESVFAYDPDGRLVLSEDALGTRTRYGRDGAGRILTRTDDEDGTLERTLRTVYNGVGDVTLSVDGEGGETRFDYDETGNLVRETDSTGVVTAYEYDARNRQSAVADPATGRTVYAYDGNDNLVRVTDAAGEVTTYEYDAADRLVRSVDALGGVRTFAYDARDNLTLVTDANGNETRFAYDALDRPVSRTNALSETWTFAYDARDNRVRTIKPDGAVITSTYDDRSDLLAMTGTGLEQLHSYDAAGNLLSATANGIERSFAYDVLNRPETATTRGLFGQGAVNATLAYAYDALGRRSGMTDGFGGQTAYAYDSRDAFTALTAPSGSVYEMTHDASGRPTGRVAPGVTSVMAYEAGSGRLADLTHGALSGFNYAYDARGDLTSVYEPGVRVRGYDHDALQRLTEVRANGAVSETYALDPEGNREASHLSAGHEVGPANRLLSTDDWTYGYDANGNRVSKTAKDGSERWAYAYDVLDRLVEVRKDGVLVEAYTYDGLGDRSVIEAKDGSLTGIVHDEEDRLLDLRPGADGQATLRARYTHGEKVDEPLEVETFAENGDALGVHTYHADHLGTIRALADVSGNAVATYDYDSYGNLIEVIEAAPLSHHPQPFGYTGRERDRATRLYHYRARAYDPETGVFLQEDPIWFQGGDYNTYRYVANRPVMLFDPSGLTASGYSQQARQSSRSASALRQTGRQLACTFGTIASVFEVLDGGGKRNISVDPGRCGAKAISKKQTRRILKTACRAVEKNGKGPQRKGERLELIIIDILQEVGFEVIEEQATFNVDTGEITEERRSDATVRRDRTIIDLEVKGGKHARLTPSQKRKLSKVPNLVLNFACK